MNFNNTDNLVTLFLCLFIIIYHSFTFLNLPINIINILRNPLVLLILILILTFIVKNKIHILLSIILYFVVIVKSSENENVYVEKDLKEMENIEENKSIYEEDESIDEEDKDENVSKNEMNNTNQVKIEEENMYTLLNNDVKMENDYEVVEDIKQNENIISNVTQTQLDKIQGDNFNHCK